MADDRTEVAEMPSTLDPEQAEASGYVLWSMELAPMSVGGLPQPVVAHRIVSFDRNDHGEIIAARTVCGQRHPEGVHGCWKLPEGEMPLARPYVHCGWAEEDQGVTPGEDDRG
jgi:hypothetical protein